MNHSASRRRFLATSALAGFAATRASAASEPGPPIIDTHVHLWDLKTFHLSWLAGAPALNRSFLWDDYRKAAAGLIIVKSIYMEVDVDAAQQEQEARALAELCRRGETSLAAVIISGRPAA